MLRKKEIGLLQLQIITGGTNCKRGKDVNYTGGDDDLLDQCKCYIVLCGNIRHVHDDENYPTVSA